MSETSAEIRVPDPLGPEVAAVVVERLYPGDRRADRAILQHGHLVRALGELGIIVVLVLNVDGHRHGALLRRVRHYLPRRESEVDHWNRREVERLLFVWLLYVVGVSSFYLRFARSRVSLGLLRELGRAPR